MSCSLRMNIISLNCALKNRYYQLLLSQSRYLCSKDNDVKTGSSSTECDSSQEKETKQSKDEVMKKKSKSLWFKPAPVTDEQKEAAKQKLMSLLSDIKVTPEQHAKPSNLNLAKAVKRVSKKERLQKMEEERITPEKEMNKAVKAIASNFKEDSEKVESELSKKLTTLDLVKSEKIEIEETTDDASPMNEINENLMSSVEEVAETISENPIPSRSELTQRLMRLSLDRKGTSDDKKSVRSVIENMIVKKSGEPSAERKSASFIRREKTLDRQIPTKTSRVARKIEPVNLFDAKPLNIFTPGSEAKSGSSNVFWQKLEERQLRLLTQFAPANAFEEMIMWTEQGKHWKLPIDNETEMGEEENVGFHEHVFLEKHLEGFPTKGPIRHFMELVCVGLSKNPYITVERKVENIEWFRNYFKEKEDILKEAGVLD